MDEGRGVRLRVGWVGKTQFCLLGRKKLFYEVGWVRLGRKIPTFSGSGWIKIQTTAYWSWFWVRRSQLLWVELRYIGFGLESYNFLGLDGFAWVILQLSWIVLGWVGLGWIRKSLQLFCARNFRDVGSVSIFLENVCINVRPFLRFFQTTLHKTRVFACLVSPRNSKNTVFVEKN